MKLIIRKNAGVVVVGKLTEEVRLRNAKEYSLNNNGYQEVIRILQEEGYKIISKEQRDEWVNKDSRYSNVKDCEIHLEGRYVAEISSSKLEKDGLVPSANWILISYDDVGGFINKCRKYII